MASDFNPEDLSKLGAQERAFIDSFTDESKKRAVACSLIQHRLPDRLSVGDDLPDLTLARLGAGEPVRLRHHVGERPLLLAFGSYT